MTRVLHVIKGLGPGGAEQLLVQQARATEPGHDIDVRVAYLVGWKDHLVPVLEDAGWSTVCLDSARPWDLRWLVRFRRLTAESGIDVVHGHSPLVSSMTRLVLRTVPRERRPRSVYTEHNEWRRHHRWTRWSNAATIRLEDRVLAVSEGVRASMPADLDVEVVIHGIDVDAVASQIAHRDDVRSELGIGRDEYVIGIVANLRREKAYDVLLEAAVQVVEDDPDVRFVSVGQGGFEDEIRELHRRSGLGDRFLLLGYRPDATRIMSGFDCFTLASRHEGLPVALMEAAALGLPIVATAVGGIPEALAGTDATLVPPDDPGALARAYRERRTIRETGVPLIVGSDSRSVASELASVYRELAER